MPQTKNKVTPEQVFGVDPTTQPRLLENDPRFSHLSSKSRRIVTDNRLNDVLTPDDRFFLTGLLDRGEDPLMDDDFMNAISDPAFELIQEISASLVDAPEDRVRSPQETLRAVQEGLLRNEFEIPVTGDPIGFGARAAASFGVTPEEKKLILRQRGLDAETLPSGTVVIKNPDGSISNLEQEGLEVGDVADALGPGTEAVPATIGGLMGSPTVVGSVAGAASGAAIGSEVRSLITNLLGAPVSPGETLTRAGTAAAIDAGLTLAMFGTGGLLKGVGNRDVFKKPLEAPFKDVIDVESMRVRPLFRDRGGDLPVDALSKSPIVGIIRGGSSRTLGGTEVIGQEDRLAREALNRIVKEFSDDVSTRGVLKSSDIGSFAQDGFALARRAFQGQADDRFNNLTNVIGDNHVVPRNAIAYLERVLKGHGMIDDAGRVVSQQSPMRPGAFNRFIKELEHLKKGRFNYNRLKVERTLVRTKSKAQGTAQSINKGLEAALTDDLLENATRIGELQGNPALVREVADLNAWYGRNKFLFDESDIAKILKDGDPSQVTKQLFRGNNVDRIKRAKEVLERPHFEFLSRQWLDDIVDKATKSTAFGDEFDPLVFDKELKRVGDDVIEEAFGDKAQFVFDIRDAGMALARGKERQVDPLLTGNFMRDLIGLITHPIQGSVEFIKGKKVAEFLTSETGKDFLTTGTSSPVLHALSAALRPTGTAIRGTSAAVSGAAPSAPVIPFISELLSQRGVGTQSAPSDATRR